MTKVLARAGVSLADVYDVEGSIAGVDQLLTGDVTTFHEMGGTIFSERLTSEIVRVQTGTIAQSTDFDADFAGVLPTGVPIRIVQLSIITDPAGRLTRCAIVARSNLADQEIPLFIFDGSNDGVRMQDAGAAVATHEMLGTDNAMRRLPAMLVGSGVRETTVQNLFLRGTSSAFGAGTVQLTGLALIQFPRLEGVSSRGLPLPSW